MPAPQQNKILDKREELLNERELQFNKKIKLEAELDTRIEVLEKQITIKSGILDGVNSAIETAKSEFEMKQLTYNKQLNNLDSQIKYKEARVIKLNSALSLKEQDFQPLTDKKATLLKEIKEHQVYLISQEEVVNNTVAEWNDILTGFKQEADNIKDDKEKYLRDMVRLDQEKTEAGHEIENVQEKLSKLEQVYQQQINEKKSKLDELDSNILVKQNQLTDIITDAQIKEKGLAVRERAIKLKEVALNKQEADISQKERRLKGSYGLAGLEY